VTPADLLSVLAKVNLAAGAAILLVIFLRKGVRSVFGARVAYGLWLLPALASIAVLMPARRVAAAASTAAAHGLHFAILNSLSSGPTPDLSAALVGVWLAGVLGVGVMLARLQLRFERAVRSGLAGPAVVGLIAPKIITPGDFNARFSADERKLILAHEHIHIARQDCWVNGIWCAAECLGWFNPLIHLGAGLVRVDQELACDETLVARFPDARHAYAQALVKAQLAIWPLPLGCNWPSRSEHPLLERIAMLKHDARNPARRLAGAAAVAAFCVGASFAAWAAQPPAPQDGSAPAVSSAKAAILPPVNITANSGRVIDGKRDSVWNGGASATLGDERLMADEIEADGAGAGLRLAAKGRVLYISPRRTARADHAVYERSSHTLSLTGNVVAIQDQKEVRAQSLVIDLAQ
jgi:beta-lactamase regulating signal transducer with metallopeptidase domain/lipopolysaccharide export system protein LptA